MQFRERPLALFYYISLCSTCTKYNKHEKNDALKYFRNLFSTIKQFFDLYLILENSFASQSRSPRHIRRSSRSFVRRRDQPSAASETSPSHRSRGVVALRRFRGCGSSCLARRNRQASISF